MILVHAVVTGSKVMIVEDDLLIADSIERALHKGGYAVCGIARTVGEAIALAKLHSPALAVIDLRLEHGELGTAICPQLADPRAMGILYASGNTARILLTAADGEACLEKPYSTEDLLRGLEIVTEIVATGEASGPFPPGFQRLPH
jgi:ActR/RegA family two-component response regulator